MCRKLDGLLYLLLMLTWWWRWWRYTGGWPREGLLCWGGGGAEIEAAADSFILPLLVLLLMQLGLAISGVMVRTPLILELRLFLSFTLNIIEYHLITVSSSYHSNIVRVSSLLVAFLCWWFMVWQLSRLVDCRGFWPLRLQRTSPKS